MSVALALVVLGTVATVIGGAWLLHRWWRPIDSYHPRDYADPPVFDPGGWLGGNR